MGLIKAAWKGEEKLWKVFWIYNFLLGGLLTVSLDMIPETSETLLLVVALVTLAWVIWVTVSLWRCAFNSNWRGWGYIVRVLIGLSVVALVLMIFGVAPVDEANATSAVPG